MAARMGRKRATVDFREMTETRKSNDGLDSKSSVSVRLARAERLGPLRQHRAAGAFRGRHRQLRGVGGDGRGTRGD